MMNNSLERFQIIGLYGNKNFDVSFTDNTLILVGENGSGKTTFLRILFYFLSGRWISLLKFRFESIVATIEGYEYSVNHKEIFNTFKIDRRLLSRILPSMRKEFSRLLEQSLSGSESARHELERLIIHNSANPGLILRKFDLSRQFDLLEESPKENDKIQTIRKAIAAKILYLPTYRRIEEELSSIFKIDADIDIDDFRIHRNTFRQNNSGDEYIELVEFGMNDVQTAINDALKHLKEFARESLNELTMGYLGDVVDKEYDSFRMEEIASVSKNKLESVINRIHDSILNEKQKEHLREVIESARSADSPTEHQKIIYHYLFKLLRFQESLQEEEDRISKFCELCSEYIVDKKFVYDSPTFNFSIVPKNESMPDPKIELKDLSSGEKQIVSLFSHLYLSGQKNFFILIDEPELSISVPWQRRFLADIWAGEFCKGLVAVTHSPFIYDNDLRPYAHSIGEFVNI